MLDEPVYISWVILKFANFGKNTILYVCANIYTVHLSHDHVPYALTFYCFRVENFWYSSIENSQLSDWQWLMKNS